MRRLFIMRKDLNMSTGKLLAQTMHCAEAYWTRGLRSNLNLIEDSDMIESTVKIPKDIFEQYLCGTFTKQYAKPKVSRIY